MHSEPWLVLKAGAVAFVHSYSVSLRNSPIHTSVMLQFTAEAAPVFMHALSSPLNPLQVPYNYILTSLMTGLFRSECSSTQKLQFQMHYCICNIKFVQLKTLLYQQKQSSAEKKKKQVVQFWMKLL